MMSCAVLVKGCVSVAVARRLLTGPVVRYNKLKNNPAKLIFVVTFLAANAKHSPGMATEPLKTKHLWNAWVSEEGQNNVRAAG